MMIIKLQTLEVPPAVPLAAAHGLLLTMTPYRTYALGLDQVAEGVPPSDDFFVGWSFLSYLSPEVGISAFVDKRSVFSDLTAGARIAWAMQAAENVDARADLPEDSYEIALLSIHGLYTESLWLRSKSGVNDRIIPYDFPERRKLVKNTPYLVGNFIDTIRSHAEEGRAADPDYKPPTVDRKLKQPAVDMELEKIAVDSKLKKIAASLKRKRRAGRSKQHVDKKPEPPASA